MHRALEVDEILETVLRQLDKCSLARAMRTCRSWFPPAARCLWHAGAERGFERLIWPCIDVVRESDTFEDLIASETWKYFRLYSALIRSLDIKKYWILGQVAEFLRTIAARKHEITTVPLFPQLRSLAVTPSDSTDLAWVQLLLCPSLVSFELWWDGYVYGNGDPHGSVLLAFLGSLATHAPALTHAVLSISTFLSHDDYARQVDEASGLALAKLGHLRSLTCTSAFAFGHVGLGSLARLPRLSELTISGKRERVMRHAAPAESESLPPSLELCPSLLRIRFGMINLVKVTQFLLRLPSSTLQEIELRSIEPDRDVLAGFVRACARFRMLRVFKLAQHELDFLDLDLSQLDGGGGADMTTGLQLAWFAPLAGCRDMKVFEIRLGGPRVSCTVDDDHLTFFARSWPDIETFRLSQSAGSLLPVGERRDRERSARPPGLVTQKSLLAFATHCHHLRSLHLPRIEVDSFSLSDGQTTCDRNMKLTDLSFQLAARDGDGAHAARVLDCVRWIWPNAHVGGVPLHAMIGTCERGNDEDEVEKKKADDEDRKGSEGGRAPELGDEADESGDADADEDEEELREHGVDGEGFVEDEY